MLLISYIDIEGIGLGQERFENKDETFLLPYPVHVRCYGGLCVCYSRHLLRKFVC